MSKLKPVFDFYKSVLSLSSMTVSDEGFVSVTLGGEEKPCMIDGKRLLMPYNDMLKNFDPGEQRIFHPIMESLARGESEILEKLRTNFIVKCNYVVGRIGAGLLTVLGSPNLHSKLDLEQSLLLETIKDNFEGSAAKWAESVISKFSKKKSPPFIDMRLKKLGMYKGKTYPRLGVVFFPLYESMVNRSHEEIGLQVREVKLYKQIINFIFNGWMDDKEAYCRPSDSEVAPFLVAFIKTAICVAESLNKMMDTFKDYIFTTEEDYKNCYFNLEGLDAVENLVALLPLVRLIPAQLGNDGRVEKIESAAVSTPVQQQQTVAAPVYQPVAINDPQLASAPAVPSTFIQPPPVQNSAWGALNVPAPAPMANPFVQMQQQNAIAQAFTQTPSWASPNVAPSFTQSQSGWSGIAQTQAPMFGGTMNTGLYR